MAFLIFKLVVFTTFWCVGIYINAREPGDLFFWLAEKSKHWILAKPIVHCVNCMASIHSAIVLVIYFWTSGLWVGMEPTWENVGKVGGMWLLVAVICSATNGIVYLAHLTMECYVDKYFSQKKIDEADERSE